MKDTDLVTAPLTWTSDDPHLSGNFMPIGPEIDASDLHVVAGRIPPDLSGAYMRNGPNPQFAPISYTYPMDGDGMIHAVYFDNGRARYRNRFVQTPGLRAERRAGRAIYGGLQRPVPVDPALVAPDGDPGPFKSGGFIGIRWHGGHLLALAEADPAYELTMELETIGRWTGGTGQTIDIGAHMRRHPTTSDLYGIKYYVEKPVVDVLCIGPDCALKRTIPVALPHASMIHDFVLTEHHLVFVIGPVVFDLEAMMQGKPLLAWKPEIGTRIGLIPLDGSAPRWIEIEPFWVFHFANAFERNGRVVVDYVRHENMILGDAPAGAPPKLHRLEIDLATAAVTQAALGDFSTEFPRINDTHEALEHRYVYSPTRTPSLTMPDPPSATYNALVKTEPDTGRIWQRDLGNRIGGEPVFIPRPGGRAEDDGYIAMYVYDPAEDASQLVLLDARDIEADPAAIIALPQRIPQGLHGNWMAG